MDEITQLRRVIGRYDGHDHGTLLICLGGIHGNEPAGVQAIDILLHLLEIEPLTNPGFRFRGRFLGLAGNLGALQAGKRFIRHDLNRLFIPAEIDRLMTQPDPESLLDEDWEMVDLIRVIRNEIDDYRPERVVVLDIHSTSAEGGIFVIASQHPESVRIGTELHAPVVLDFDLKVHGTTMAYFTSAHFPAEMVTIVFECGQHTAGLSVNRALAAMINCMRTIGCVRPKDVENKYDRILLEYSRGLPKVARLIEHYRTIDATAFALTRNYENFEAVSAGETIAMDSGLPVKARQDGLILLPKYQEQGDDGYFLVRPVDY